MTNELLLDILSTTFMGHHVVNLPFLLVMCYISFRRLFEHYGSNKFFFLSLVGGFICPFFFYQNMDMSGIPAVLWHRYSEAYQIIGYIRDPFIAFGYLLSVWMVIAYWRKMFIWKRVAISLGIGMIVALTTTAIFGGTCAQMFTGNTAIAFILFDMIPVWAFFVVTFSWCFKKRLS